MRKKKFGIIRKRILSLLLATMMISSSAVTVFATDDLSLSGDVTTTITEQTPDETDVPEETPEETDVTDETPEETDVTDETPEETDVTDETPEETDVPDETPEETDVTDETPEETDDQMFGGKVTYHYISDDLGGDLLPYEYYAIQYDADTMTEMSDGISEVPSYYASYYSSEVRYSSSVGYNSLTQEQKKAYDYIYAAACEIDESTEDAILNEKNSKYYFGVKAFPEAVDIDSDSLFTTYLAFIKDNPQFFWIGHHYSYSYIENPSMQINGIAFGIDSTASDYADGDYRMQIKEEIFTEVETVLEGAEDYGNDYTREWYIHNYLCEKTVYDLAGDHAHDISGLIVDGKAVCESYAKCFQLFMNALDIDVMYITGTSNGGGHAWNQVGLVNDGEIEWYNVDVTWDDQKTGYKYNYFNVVDSDGSSYDFTNGNSAGNKHTPDPVTSEEYVYSPKTCNSTTYSYKNHAKNYMLAPDYAVAKIGETEYRYLDQAIEESEEGDTIVLLNDAIYDGATMPEHALTIDCNGYTIDFVQSLDMNADLTIKNTSGFDLDMCSFDLTYYEYIFLNDNTLSFEGTWNGYFPVIVSGYIENSNNEDSGKVVIDLENENEFAIMNMVGVENITIADNEYASFFAGFELGDVVVGENSVLSTFWEAGSIASIDIPETSYLEVSSAVHDAFFIIHDTIQDTVIIKAANMEEGLPSLITRLNYSVDTFKFFHITENGETEYYITMEIGNEGQYIYKPFKTADFTISDGTDSVKRCTFREALEYVGEQEADSLTTYTITYTGTEETVCITEDVVFDIPENCSLNIKGSKYQFEGNVSFAEGYKEVSFIDSDVKFIRNSISGNNGTISFQNTKGVFDGCTVSRTSLTVFFWSDVEIIDSKNTNLVTDFSMVSLGGESKLSIGDYTFISELASYSPDNIINLNAGKAEILSLRTFEDGSFIFNINSDSVIITVNNISLASGKVLIHSASAKKGQKIMNVPDDYSAFFTTDMKNAAGEPFSVVYRAGTLVYDVPVYRLEGVGIFSEWSDILSYINKNGSSSSDYEVTLLCDVEINSLTLPSTTKANSITFSGEDMTFTGTSLKLPVTTTFACNLNAENTAITASKDVTLKNADIKSITGTRTSKLGVTGTLNAESVKTFSVVDAITGEIVAETNVTVTDFIGNLTATTPKTVVSIAKAYDAEIKLVSDANEKFAKVTVNEVAEDDTLTVTIVNAGREVIPVSGGTVILYTSGKDISEKVEITNVMENDGELKAYYYAKSKTVKAEWPYAATLTYEEEGEEVSVDCPNLDRAFDIINAKKDNTKNYIITLNVSTDYTSMTLPTYANSITFDADEYEYTTFTYTGTTLKLPVNTYFNCKFIAENTAITASKNAGFHDARVKSITGTKTAKLIADGDLYVQTVKTFGNVDATRGEIITDTNVTVTEFSGNITATTPKTVVSIAKAYDANIKLVSDANEKFAKVTVNDVAEDEEIVVAVVDENGDNVPVADGTIVLYTTGKDISDSVSISNKNTNGKDLTAFYYKNNKSIKAEWEDAITLSYGEVEKNLPNIEKVFEEINANRDKTVDYTIQFNTPVEFNTLTLPTYANSIDFTGSEMTFTGTTLKLPVTTTFACNLNAENTAITASKDLLISNATVKSITGARNSKLVAGKLIADSVKTFATVSGDIDVTSSMAVTGFAGHVKVNTPKTTVSIANVTEPSGITLVSDETGKFGKVTITDVAEDVTATVTVIDAEENKVVLESGTIVLYTAGKDLSGAVNILNKTSDEKLLTAFYYKNNKSIKAEWENAITLTYSDVKVDLPNIDKVFEVINANKDKTIDYEITFNTPVEFNTLTLPTYANSITFDADEYEYTTFTYTGTTLKLPVNTYFNCKFIAENTAITASKDVTFRDATVKSLTGTRNSNLGVTGTLNAESVKTFSAVDAITGEIVAETNVTVTDFIGNLTATTPKTVVSIAKAYDANIKLVSDANEKFAKVTVNDVAEYEEVVVAVVDGNDELISFFSNTPVLYSSSDIAENVTILNETANGNPLSAYYVKAKKAVYVGYEEAVLAVYVDVNETGSFEKYFTNLEEAIAYIPLDSLYVRINVEDDVRVEKLSFPKYKNCSMEFMGGDNAILLDNVTSVPIACAINFYDLIIDSTKSFKINATGELYLENVLIYSEMTANITASDNVILKDFSAWNLASISGKGTKEIAYYGMNNIDYKLSGFGEVIFCDDSSTTISNAVTIKDAVYGMDTLVNLLPGANVKFTDVYDANGDVSMGMFYCSGNVLPVTITGEVYGNIILKHQTKFTSGQQLLVASKADLSSFTIYKASCPDEKDYVLTRNSGKVYIKPVLLEVSDGVNNYGYAEWTDFVAMVNENNDSEAYYNVTLLGDYNVGGALTMPKAGYYSKIMISSEEDNVYDLTFTGGIKQTGNMVLDNLNMKSVNTRGVESAYTITMGKYNINSSNVDFGKVTFSGTYSKDNAVLWGNIGGNITVTDIILSDTTVTGTVKTSKNLVVSGDVVFKNTVNVYGIERFDEDAATITLKKGKLLTIGRGGSGTKTITINLDVPVTAKTKVGTVASGTYNGNFVGGNVDIAVEGTTIYAYPKA